MAPRKTRLEACKRYMRVDGGDEDEVILALMAAAERYPRGAGIVPGRGRSELYDLALWRLTLHYYDRRDAVGNEAAFPVGLRPVITQLKLGAAANPGARPFSACGWEERSAIWAV